jgi:hypothetical protein
VARGGHRAVRKQQRFPFRRLAPKEANNFADDFDRQSLGERCGAALIRVAVASVVVAAFVTVSIDH